MLGTAHLLDLARAYAQGAGVEMTTVSSRVFDDGKKLSAIEAGGDILSGRLSRAVHWFADNWPERAVWPSHIGRPETPVSSAQEVA